MWRGEESRCKEDTVFSRDEAGALVERPVDALRPESVPVMLTRVQLLAPATRYRQCAHQTHQTQPQTEQPTLRSLR